MSVEPNVDAARFELRCHRSADDARVAGWVSGARGLFLLAPATPPPLTARKVAAWTRPQDNPLAFWPAGGAAPIGYAELNSMPRDPLHLWIGHLVVDPALRGRGLGTAFVRELLRAAFADFAAHRLSLVVFPENQPALRCYRKAGFARDTVQIKTFDHVPGRYRMLQMSVTRQRYERGRLSPGD